MAYQEISYSMELMADISSNIEELFEIIKNKLYENDMNFMVYTLPSLIMKLRLNINESETIELKNLLKIVFPKLENFVNNNNYPQNQKDAYLTFCLTIINF